MEGLGILCKEGVRDGGLHPNLEQRVPKNHILKKIEEKVDMAREVEKQQVFLNPIRALGYAWCTQCKF
jgi:hypothetical protein